MHDDFLLETVWVLAVHGWKPLAFGLWIALFIGVDSGYRAWQSGPNPPDEAFSDTGGPFTMLFLGWVPATLLLGTVFWLTRRPGGTRRPSPQP